MTCSLGESTRRFDFANAKCSGHCNAGSIRCDLAVNTDGALGIVIILLAL